jgi:hypothetical protein
LKRYNRCGNVFFRDLAKSFDDVVIASLQESDVVGVKDENSH